MLFSNSFAQSGSDSSDGGSRNRRPDMKNPRDHQRPERPGSNRKGNAGNIANQLQQKKNLYIMRRLELSPADSAQFFPIYQKYQNEWTELKAKSRVPLVQGLQAEKDKSKTPLKEHEQLKLIENEMSAQQQKIDLMKKYNQEYKKIIPALKVAELYQIEEMFIEEQLLRSMRNEDSPRSHH